MESPSAFPVTLLRSPSFTAHCTCEHWVYCDCACHARQCDPSEVVCDIAFLPDEGGLTRWGCPGCTPGDGAPHLGECELIGWNVPFGGRPEAPG